MVLRAYQSTKPWITSPGFDATWFAKFCQRASRTLAFLKGIQSFGTHCFDHSLGRNGLIIIIIIIDRFQSRSHFVAGQLTNTAIWTDWSNYLIWSNPEVISTLSNRLVLARGDLVLTGTPAGVGPLVPGDHVKGRMEGLESIDITIMSSTWTEFQCYIWERFVLQGSIDGPWRISMCLLN